MLERSPHQPPRAFYAWRFLSACLPFLPVATVCYRARGLDLGHVLTLGTVYGVAVAVLGVPLGVMVDRIGARRALQLGALTLAAACVLVAGSDGYAGLVVAQLVFATAGALDAGADSAWLWTHLPAVAARAAEARSTTVKLLGNVAGFALGGALAQLAPSAPFVAGAVFALAAAACAGLLASGRAPSSAGSIDALATVPSKGALADLRAGAHELFSSQGRARDVLLAALALAMARAAVSATGPYLVGAGVPLAVVGLVSAGGAALAALCARYTLALSDRVGERTLLGFVPVALLFALVALGLAPSLALPSLVLALAPQLVAALHAPLWRSHLNARIADPRRRATVLALDSTITRVISALFSSLLTLLVSNGGPRAALRGGAVLGALGLLALALTPSVRRASPSRPSLTRTRLGWAAAALGAMLLVLSARGGIAQADDALPPSVKAATPAGASPASASSEIASLAPATEHEASFLDGDDDVALAHLCDAPIAHLTLNPRGTTIKYRARLADGRRAAVRPAQRDEAGYAKADVAAYRLSRLLGLGRVAPACLRMVPRALLLEAAGASRERVDREVTAGDTVEVSVVVWVDHLRDVALEAPASRDTDGDDRGTHGPHLDAAERSRLAAFDFLIANWDRTSGGSTFRRGSASVWLDNAAGFGRYGRAMRRRNERELGRFARFSRSQIATLRAVTDEQIVSALAPAGLPARAVNGVLARRAWLLERIDELSFIAGQAEVLAFE